MAIASYLTTVPVRTRVRTRVYVLEYRYVHRTRVPVPWSGMTCNLVKQDEERTRVPVVVWHTSHGKVRDMRCNDATGSMLWQYGMVKHTRIWPLVRCSVCHFKLVQDAPRCVFLQAVHKATGKLVFFSFEHFENSPSRKKYPATTGLCDNDWKCASSKAICFCFDAMTSNAMHAWLTKQATGAVATLCGVAAMGYALQSRNQLLSHCEAELDAETVTTQFSKITMNIGKSPQGIPSPDTQPDRQHSYAGVRRTPPSKAGMEVGLEFHEEVDARHAVLATQNSKSRLIFLGSGSSSSTPIGFCLTEESAGNPKYSVAHKALLGAFHLNKNHRLNPSVLLHHVTQDRGDFLMQIDAGKTFRESIVRW